MPREPVLERPPGSSDRRPAGFGSLPRTERLGPDVTLFVPGQPIDPKLNGFFEKLSLGHPKLPRRALHLIERGFIEPRREDLLHT